MGIKKIARNIMSRKSFQLPKLEFNIFRRNNNELQLNQMNSSPFFDLNRSLRINELGCSLISTTFVAYRTSFMDSRKINSSIPVEKIMANTVMIEIRINIVQ
jgi:hypothetical protein